MIRIIGMSCLIYSSVSFANVQMLTLNTDGSVAADRENVDTHTYVQTLFPGASEPEERWASLLTSSYIFGSANTTTRGIDLIGVMGGFSALTIYDTGTPTTLYTSPYFSPTNFSVSAGPGTIWATDIVNGPYMGTSLINNPDIVAMDVSKVILYDSVTDNLYAYNREDRFAANNGSLLLWTFGDFDNSGDLDNTFTNGPLANQNISNQISNLIAVDNNLYFIDGDNTVHAYDQDLDFVETSTITLSGDLAGETLSDLVDGLVDGYTYLGWDLGGIGVLGISDPRVVPEPSSYALLIGIVSFSLSYFRRRRRQ